MDIEDAIHLRRALLSGIISHENAASPLPSWKTALWEANSVEPAMLRAPFIIIIFVFLWGLNVLFFEKSRIQYYSALNITKGYYFPFSSLKLYLDLSQRRLILPLS